MRRMNFSMQIMRRFLQESGAILTIIAIVGAISTGIALYHFGKSTMEEVKKVKKDVTSIEVTGEEAHMDKYDPNEVKLKWDKTIVKLACEGGKVAVEETSCDDTGVTQMLDYTVESREQEKTTQKEEQKEGIGAAVGAVMGVDEKTVEDILKEENLPQDKLTRDIARSIYNIAEENISSFVGNLLDEIKAVTVDTVKGIINVDPEKIDPEKDSSEVKDLIRSNLNERSCLEDQRIIQLREKLNKALNYKRYIEEKLSYYKQLEEKGYRITDTSEFSDLTKTLQDVEKRVSDLSSELEEFQNQIPTTSIVAEKTPDQSADEGGAEESEEESKEETIESETNDKEEQSKDNTSEEVTEELSGTITLHGSGGGAKTYQITMIINLDTGNISGTVRREGGFQTDMNEYRKNLETGEIELIRTYTVECPGVYNGTISGSMNLETKNITVSVSGTIHITATSGDCAGAEDSSASFNLNGMFNIDNLSASGTDSMGNPWSVQQ